jgi:hypothetical protein
MQLGNVGEWIAAIGTVGAIALALWQHNKLAQEQTEGAEKQQAEQVTVYGVFSDATGPWANRYAEKIVVHNASAQPVYHLAIKFFGYRYALANIAAVPKKTYCIRKFTVPPGKWTITTDPKHFTIQELYSVEIAFTDASGRTWHRNRDGLLAKRDAAFTTKTFLDNIAFEEIADPRLYEAS